MSWLAVAALYGLLALAYFAGHERGYRRALAEPKLRQMDAQAIELAAMRRRYERRLRAVKGCEVAEVPPPHDAA